MDIHALVASLDDRREGNSDRYRLLHLLPEVRGHHTGAVIGEHSFPTLSSFYTLFWSAITLEGAHRVPDEVCDAEGAALAAATLQEVGDGGAADLETIQDENSYTKISARQKKDSVPTEKLREEELERRYKVG